MSKMYYVPNIHFHDQSDEQICSPVIGSHVYELVQSSFGIH